MISFEQTLSTNDYQHQILKADVGQDVTMSCLFDEDKIEQVRIYHLTKQKKKQDRKKISSLEKNHSFILERQSVSIYHMVKENINYTCNGSLFILELNIRRVCVCLYRFSIIQLDKKILFIDR
jgi:hypothetical protein